MADVSVHPLNPHGYTVRCEVCGEVAWSRFEDVARALADRHEHDATVSDEP